jgi:hypothetical protein
MCIISRASCVRHFYQALKEVTIAWLLPILSDEICPDSEYESQPTNDNHKPNKKPDVEPPPPVRDRTLGGIDYYLLSYDDPIFDDEEEY